MNSTIIHRNRGLAIIECEGERHMLDLARCDQMWEEQLITAFEERDAEGFIFCAGDNIRELGIVLDNFGALQKRGMAEEALAIAFTTTRTVNAGFPSATIERAFRECERDVLRDQGDAPPATPIRVYRGVAGEGAYRRVRGLSWTTDLDCACWFALRFSLPEPAVYTGNIREADLFYFTDQRSEREVVGRPKSCRRHPLTVEQMHAASARWTEQKRKRQGEHEAPLVSETPATTEP